MFTGGNPFVPGALVLDHTFSSDDEFLLDTPAPAEEEHIPFSNDMVHTAASSLQVKQVCLCSE